MNAAEGGRVAVARTLSMMPFNAESSAALTPAAACLSTKSLCCLTLFMSLASVRCAASAPRSGSAYHQRAQINCPRSSMCARTPDGSGIIMLSHHGCADALMAGRIAL